MTLDDFVVDRAVVDPYRPDAFGESLYEYAQREKEQAAMDAAAEYEWLTDEVLAVWDERNPGLEERLAEQNPDGEIAFAGSPAPSLPYSVVLSRYRAWKAKQGGIAADDHAGWRDFWRGRIDGTPADGTPDAPAEVEVLPGKHPFDVVYETAAAMDEAIEYEDRLRDFFFPAAGAHEKCLEWQQERARARAREQREWDAYVAEDAKAENRTLLCDLFGPLTEDHADFDVLPDGGC